VLYGTSIDAVELDEREDFLSDSRRTVDFEAVVRSEPSEEALWTWRRKDSVGKLHNLVLVTHVQKSLKRQRFFETKQNVGDHSDGGQQL
jgi:hypothetical protein